MPKAQIDRSHRRPHSFYDGHGILERDVLEEQTEFFTTDTGKAVCPPQLSTSHACDRHQYLVAGLMPKLIVDPLKEVSVKNDEEPRPSRNIFYSYAIQPLPEVASVVEPSQWIAAGNLAELVVASLQLCIRRLGPSPGQFELSARWAFSKRPTMAFLRSK